ncbi:glutathione S-transferase family protein [Pleurocapsales cyanobacterium LEGE 10410]|nr:glutathione S-transferase family protein [Pleurocapsales cyanobacterium LEGE 10410]
MLKLYHNPISANSRRVWVALLEKDIPFEQVIVKLDGDQFAPEFVEISPFHHIPVLVDGDFILVESLAILDYLEAKYSQTPLLPTDAKALATVRMVEMVTVNELSPILTRLSSEIMGFTKEPEKLEQAKQKAHKVLNFFEGLLGGHPYFISNCLTRADIVAGTMIPWLPSLGVPLDEYPKLKYCSELTQLI